MIYIEPEVEVEDREENTKYKKKVLFKLNVANFIQIYRNVNEWKRKRNLFK